MLRAEREEDVLAILQKHGLMDLLHWQDLGGLDNNFGIVSAFLLIPGSHPPVDQWGHHARVGYAQWRRSIDQNKIKLIANGLE